MGRQREFAAFRCSRSAEIVFRTAVATCERPLSQGADFSVIGERLFTEWTGCST